MQKLRFISGNQYKIAEVKDILHSSDIEIVPINIKIQELQTKDMKELVRDKTLKAFDEIGKPIVVEHTSIFLDVLNGFPGGLGQIFWDTVGADRFTKLFGQPGNNMIQAQTIAGYCDGWTIKLFEGVIKGTIPSKPCGAREFQWDCVFIPEGYNETFAEMGSRKNLISMRKIAFQKLAKHITLMPKT